MKKALIIGITGQDGSYLAEFLLNKGYEVHGIKRRASSRNTERINHLYQQPHGGSERLIVHTGDLAESESLMRVIRAVCPDEIYNLGAQSHVAVSFETPEYTGDINALGAVRVLEAIRLLGLEKQTRFYQASTSEMYGKALESPQNENTPFNPRSPYAIAKTYAHWTTVNYREAYGMYACNGILFNHESKRRGQDFVTRKITRGLAKVVCGLEECIHLGNLNARRDWGHAKDYCRMQWLMLQQEAPEDFVIATGNQFSVREFTCMAAAELGILLRFEGEGSDEKGVVDQISMGSKYSIREGDVIVKIDPQYIRPLEVDALVGDSSKAQEKLGWQPEVTVAEICAEMVVHDLESVRKFVALRESGYPLRLFLD